MLVLSITLLTLPLRPGFSPPAGRDKPAARQADRPAVATQALARAKRSLDANDVPAALRSLKVAIEADPNLYEAHDQFVFVVRESTIDRKNDDAYVATSKRATDALIEQYRAWERRFPTSNGVRYGFGSVYYEAELPQAKPYLLRTVAKNPKLAKAYEMLAIDATRWGDYMASARYEKQAWNAEPSNFTYARHYALALKGRDRGEWKDLCREVAAHFAGTDEGSQALGLIGQWSSTPKEKEAGYLEQIRRYPVAKFPSSRGGVQGLARIYAAHEPPKAIALYRELLALPENDKATRDAYQASIDQAQSLIDARDALDRGEYAQATERLAAVALPRFVDLALLDKVDLMKAEALSGGGKSQEAYDLLLRRATTQPTDAALDAIQAYGAKLGKSAHDIDAERWALFDASAKPAPAFDLYAYLEKKNVSLASLRGKTVFLSFWFPGCGPCRAEMVHLEPVVQRFKGRGLVYVGINVETGQDAYVAPFMRASGFSFAPLRDRGQKAMKAYGVSGCPTNFIIDGVGRIVYTGFMITDEARERMLSLMIQSVIDHGSEAGGHVGESRRDGIRSAVGREGSAPFWFARVVPRWQSDGATRPRGNRTPAAPCGRT